MLGRKIALLSWYVVRLGNHSTLGMPNYYKKVSSISNGDSMKYMQSQLEWLPYSNPREALLNYPTLLSKEDRGWSRKKIFPH